MSRINPPGSFDCPSRILFIWVPQKGPNGGGSCPIPPHSWRLEQGLLGPLGCTTVPFGVPNRASNGIHRFCQALRSFPRRSSLHVMDLLHVPLLSFSSFMSLSSSLPLRRAGQAK